MAYTDIDKPEDYFETKLYTGNDANNREISLGLTPDLTWIKARNVAYGHILFDRIRGLGFSLNSNNTNADRNVGSEFSWSNSGCTTDSFTVDRGSNESLNESGRPMVAWNWKAGGSASSNSNGSITSSVSANTTAGFSIVSYTGTGSNATVGHGLGSAPNVIICKNRDDSSVSSWSIYHSANTSAPETDVIFLNKTNATADDNTAWNDTAPTSSVFSVGTNNQNNGSSDGMIAYCFAEKKGYSKFGSYTGNGNADGTFVYTGMRPAFVIAKESSEARDWQLWDNKRLGYNASGGNKNLIPNKTDAEDTYADIDILSNGFKLKSTSAAHNKSGQTYIYMAFAENPFVTSTGIPSCAR